MQKKDLIKGALYGFAIGDAMGATTEFLSRSQITKPVTNIQGGGWLHLTKGDVTDDTEMMLAVANAVYTYHSSHDYDILRLICANFIRWYDTDPIDIGTQCRRAIEHALHTTEPLNPNNWFLNTHQPQALGNGSLMRALYPSLFFHTTEDLSRGIKISRSQSDLTHNNQQVLSAVVTYHLIIHQLINGSFPSFISEYTHLMEPTGHVSNTLNNALYHFRDTDSIEDCIIQSVNNGGDADTISAISGSIAGAFYGYKAIPTRWVKQLSPDVKAKLEECYKRITFSG